MLAFASWQRIAAILPMLLLVQPVLAQSRAQQIETCDNDKAPPAERLAACTAVINDSAATPMERAEALVDRGGLHDDEHDYDLAIADFTAAIALNPKDAAAFLLRGNSHDSKGDLDKALADYDSAIGLDPSDASGYFNRATVHQAKGDKSRAIADFKQALAIDPSHEGAKDGLAELAPAKP